MNSITQGIRKGLSEKLAEAKQSIDNMCAEKFSDVSYWEYASDEYYTHLPYYLES